MIAAANSTKVMILAVRPIISAIGRLPLGVYFVGACAMFLFVSAIRRRLGKQPIDKQDLA
ncbi:uncharacterized protein BKA55DRAFT_547686, partial [Fusarium redolens]